MFCLSCTGMPIKLLVKWLLPVMLLAMASFATAHGVADGDKGFLEEASGAMVGPFIYLGAKHMFTGYDHLLFLFGVIFFLYRMKDVGLYVSLFAAGHSITLIAGVYFHINVSAYLIDAIIGFSVVYKSLDNLGAFKRWFGHQPDTRAATLIFGLFHGFGLATKLQEYQLPADGLLTNLIAFNVGVELGQLLALGLMLVVIQAYRAMPSFERQSYLINSVTMGAGFLLMGLQLTGYFVA